MPDSMISSHWLFVLPATAAVVILFTQSFKSQRSAILTLGCGMFIAAFLLWLFG